MSSIDISKHILIGVLICVNIISNSLIIYSSGNILPNKDENNTKTNTTNLYLENFKNNLTISNTNSSNPNEIKKFDIFPTYGISDVTRFFNKAHKGLYFIPIFAFLFIALLFISYLVKEQDCQKFGIMSVPTLLFYKDGLIMQKEIGYRTPEEIKKIYNSIWPNI